MRCSIQPQQRQHQHAQHERSHPADAGANLRSVRARVLAPRRPRGGLLQAGHRGAERRQSHTPSGHRIAA
jgi:hypothetical protein